MPFPQGGHKNQEKKFPEFLKAINFLFHKFLQQKGMVIMVIWGAFKLSQNSPGLSPSCKYILEHFWTPESTSGVCYSLSSSFHRILDNLPNFPGSENSLSITDLWLHCPITQLDHGSD